MLVGVGRFRLFTNNASFSLRSEAFTIYCCACFPKRHCCATFGNVTKRDVPPTCLRDVTPVQRSSGVGLRYRVTAVGRAADSTEAQ